jgi:pyrroloquinoline-quinone synthase
MQDTKKNDNQKNSRNTATISERIDAEIEKRSLLKHPFYQMWSDGKLTLDHLRGYSMEYFQLVKAVPKFVEHISESSMCKDPSIQTAIDNNAREEAEHIEPWARFAGALGVPRNDLMNYKGVAKTNGAVKRMLQLSHSLFEEAIGAMYAYEMELPKISRSKIDGLKKFYGLDNNPDALNYFEIHEEADIRHAQVWRNILNDLSTDQQELAFNAAVESLNAQNSLLDSVYETYIGGNSPMLC